MQKKQILIIPGWDGTKKNWQNFINIANKKYDIFCLELPCFGNEPCPKKVWGVEEYADFVEEKIKSLNSDNLILLGHSFGGQIASYLVAKNNSLAKKLILSGAAIIREKSKFKKIIFLPFAKIGKIIFFLPFLKKFKKIAQKVLYRTINSPDFFKTSGIKREIFKKIIKQDFSDLLKNIKTPTLVVWGNRDSYVPLRFGKKIVKKIPNSKLIIIKGGKHGLHIQQPENLYNIIDNFIN